MAVVHAGIPTNEERAAAHLEAEHLANRDALRSLLIGSLLCFFWLAVGLYLLGLSFHVTDEKVGKLLFWFGLVVGNSGILGSIVWTVRKAETRGDYGR